MPEFDQDHPRDEYGRFVETGVSTDYGEGRSGQREYEGGYASKPKPNVERYYGWSRPVTGRSSFDDRRIDQLNACADSMRQLQRRMDAWDESKHPRGQPGNAGQFGPGDGGGAEIPSTRQMKEIVRSGWKGPGAPETNSTAAVPSREEQTKAGEDVKGYLQLVAEAAPGQKGTHAIVGKHGRQFFANDDTYRGKKGTPQQCYKNAALMAIDNPKYTYVEGYVTVHGVPIEHAWVVDKSGSVVDPTIRDPKGIGGYYGVPFHSEYLQKTLLKNKVYGMFGYYNKDIYDAPSGEYVQRNVGGETISEVRRPAKSETPATSLYEQHAVPTVSQFMASLPAHMRAHVNRVDQQLKEAVPTDAPVSRGGHRLPNGQFTPERQKLHEAIIRDILTPEKVRAARPAAGEAPTFTVLGGRAGSGKSFVTRRGEGPVDATKSILIDSDGVKARLPEYQGWNAAMCHEEASHVIEHAMRMAQKLKLNIVLDGTLKSYLPMKSRLDDFKSAGYKLDGYYVFAPPAVAARRAVERSMRGEKRFVHPAYVLGSTSNEQSFDGLRDYFDKWEVYDASEEGSTVKKFEGSKSDA